LGGLIFIGLLVLKNTQGKSTAVSRKSKVLKSCIEAKISWQKALPKEPRRGDFENVIE